MVSRLIATLPFVAAGVVAACAGSPPTASIAPDVSSPLPTQTAPLYEVAAAHPLPPVEPENHPKLHNVFELSENIVSGSEPEGENAFRVLKEKGIRTILSVDGKTPDLATAERYGIRYVHVPIQYKGITDRQVAEIAKSFRELEGPFYVHCFHGKHRGPAAAAIGRVVLDGAPRDRAIAEMRQYCGTSSKYEGLYGTVAHGRIPSAVETAALDWDFPSATPLDGIAGSMVPIARHADNVKALYENDWRATSDHPDLDASNEMAVLAGLFERANALPELAESPPDLRRWMHDSMVQSASLRDAMAAMRAGTGDEAAVDDAYDALFETCAACHKAYRN
ncbi:MAG: hypothetical protein ACF8XB_20230 [Planctomycetota bacterium JB042]